MAAKAPARSAMGEDALAIWELVTEERELEVPKIAAAPRAAVVLFEP